MRSAVAYRIAEQADVGESIMRVTRLFGDIILDSAHVVYFTVEVTKVIAHLPLQASCRCIIQDVTAAKQRALPIAC